MDFKVGDIVVFKTGGPLMSVSGITDSGLLCSWRDGQERREGNFGAESLRFYNCFPPHFDGERGVPPALWPHQTFVQKQTMSASEYEDLVRDFAREFMTKAPELKIQELKSGVQNRVEGASRYRHQIDLSARMLSDLWLIDCKNWKDSVDAEPVLVLATRVDDIRGAALPLRVHGSIVSTKRPTKGAKLLADHFAISIDTVHNPHEYVVRILDRTLAGLVSAAHATSG